jgi:thiamine biosynthesis lipoprotein
MTFYSASFEAIGVTNQVTVVEPDALGTAMAIAERQIAALDDACSRFRGDSELALLNRERGAVVSSLLLEAIEAGLAAAEETDGLVDPTVGNAMRALGYDHDFDVIVRQGARPLFELRQAAGWRSVVIDRAAATVHLRRGAELDLGATAKSWAADRLARAALDATGSAVLVSLGGDVAVAGQPPEGGWPILVTDDSRAQAATGQTVSIREGGLATSSTTVRRWRAGQIEMHHIVNPRNGTPAEACWRTVSVAAQSCLEANTAATAAIVLGSRALAWLEERSICARLVRTDGNVQTTGGWPSVDDEPAPTADAALVVRGEHTSFATSTSWRRSAYPGS